MRDLLNREYRRVGLVEMTQQDSTFFWDEQQVGRIPVQPDWIGVFERASASSGSAARSPRRQGRAATSSTPSPAWHSLPLRGG